MVGETAPGMSCRVSDALALTHIDRVWCGWEGYAAYGESRRYLVSSRIASSSPRSVSGYMRWFISCWMMEML
jgi:hypothetical protein